MDELVLCRAKGELVPLVIETIGRRGGRAMATKENLGGEMDGLLTAAWLIIERIAYRFHEDDVATWEEAYGKALALLVEQVADVSEYEVVAHNILRDAGDCLP